MYNRYMHHDSGTYQPIPEEEPYHAPPPPKEHDTSRGHHADGPAGLLQHLLNQFHLDRIDSGDLLLLGLLYLLFRQKADDELLFALGLLLVL